MKKYEDIKNKIWNQEIVFAGTTAALIKLPDCGTCSVVFGRNEQGYEHVSVSPKKYEKLPSWNDMCYLKDVFFEDEEEVYQIHPPKSQYVNMRENCLHLWKLANGKKLSELNV